MSEIKILPENISNRIAAGEVIERPASVVKELVENAIDAGASSIVVKIEKAGRKLISVTDNGRGMNADDALMCLEAHATSKIKDRNDIDHIMTLGFRGEAIPSIAAVSRFRLATRRHDAAEGSTVAVICGKVVENGPIGCAPGTSVSVRELFCNTPARKKFLRSDATEEKHIQEHVYMLSLPYPGIAFELMIDGRRVFSSPAHDDLLPRLQTYFGKDYASGMVKIGYTTDEVKVAGYAARHGLTRNTRREQRTFVNGRPVESPALFRGISEGYSGLIEKGRFPPVILFLRIDPLDVDVNVHPAKREIRLRNDAQVVRAVAEAIRIALRQAPSPTVTVDSRLPLHSLLAGAEIAYRSPDAETPEFMPNFGMEGRSPVEDVRRQQGSSEIAAADSSEAGEEHCSTASRENAAATGGADGEGCCLPGSGAVKILGFLDRTYILALADSGLLVIDQHAAHERVLFERLLHADDNRLVSQRLLLPITLELSRAETTFLERHTAIFARLGFEIQQLSSNTVMISAIPASLRQENAGGLLRDILSDLLDDGGTGNRKPDLETVARSACKAAVKARDILTLDEAHSLLRQMAACHLPFSCPHGRPTVINISVRELEKRFGRS